jgi:hypothetical protein
MRLFLRKATDAARRAAPATTQDAKMGILVEGRHMKQITIVAVFAVAMLASTAVARGQTYILDHFNCYQIQPSHPADAVVALKDQFRSYDAVNVLSKFRFCNPTAKGVQTPGGPVITKITHPNDHSTLYQLNPQQPVNLKVVVKNQFGDQSLTVTDARYLAVPTQKSPHRQPPVDLDHYLCYAASGLQVAVPASLADQFQRERVKVTTPVLLCNPVQKQHNGAVTDIRHPDDHLVCYTKTPRQFATARGIKNQLESTQINTIASDLLCVPSKKQVLGTADEPIE